VESTALKGLNPSKTPKSVGAFGPLFFIFFAE